MKKNPGLLLAVCVLAVIVLANVFKLNLPSGNESAEVKNVADYLFVCPLADSTWDQLAKSFAMGKRFISMFVVFMGIILFFSWGWGLYQNLLKDKFSADAYKFSWEITKAIFWVIIVSVVLIRTPNYFRAKIPVRSGDTRTEWVLCEPTSPGARAIRVNKIKKFTVFSRTRR